MSVSESENKIKASPIVLSMKFVWQSYKIMIELVKLSHKMLDLYQNLCEEAFNFMATNGRTKEAKKIFDIMSGQVKAAQKMENSPEEFEGIPNRIDLTRFDHVQKLLDLRYEIVEKALNFKFYAECYKSYEDIAYLMKRLDQAAKEIRPIPNMGRYEQRYYVNLSEIVWTAGLSLHHCVALYREYNILDMKRKNLPIETRRELISKLIMSILATSPYAGSQLSPIQLQKSFRYTLGGETVLSDFDVEAHYNKKMTELFMVSAIPSRDVIIKDIHRRNLMLFATPEIYKLFELLEGEMHTPATFAKEASGILEAIVKTNPEYSRYAKNILQTMGARVIEKMGRYYKKARLEKVKLWLPAGISDSDCEKLIVECSNAGIISALIDNNSKVLIFHTDSLSNAANRLRLSEFAQGLKNTVNLIDIEISGPALENANTRLHNKLVEKIEVDREEVQKTIEMLQRQQMEKEAKLRAKERAENIEHYDPAAAAILKKKHEESAKKQKKDIEKERRTKNITELTEKKKQRMKEAILKIKPKIKFNGKKLSTIDVSDITLKDLEGLKETLGKYEEKTLVDFIRKEVKQSDVLIRAFREEESKKLLPEWEAQTAKVREIEAKVAEERKKEHAELVSALSAIKSVKEIYDKKFVEERLGDYDKKYKENRKILAEKYKPELLKLAEKLMKEDEEKRKKEEEEQKEREKIQKEIGEDKNLKQEPEHKQKYADLATGDGKIVRAVKRAEVKKEEPAPAPVPQEEQKKKEEKKIMARPHEDEKKPRMPEKEAFAAGQSWRRGGAAAEDKKPAPEPKKAEPVPQKTEPVHKKEEKKAAPEKKPTEEKGGWRKGGEQPKAAPAKEEKKAYKEQKKEKDTGFGGFRRK